MNSSLKKKKIFFKEKQEKDRFECIKFFYKDVLEFRVKAGIQSDRSDV